jgi:hypothetical protein
MIKFVEIKKKDTNYELNEVWINPDSILQIKSDITMKNNLLGGYLPETMDGRQEFSRIHYGSGNNISVATVIGSPQIIAEKIYKYAGKELLKG